jgi:hypothetical protein
MRRTKLNKNMRRCERMETAFNMYFTPLKFFSTQTETTPALLKLRKPHRNPNLNLNLNKCSKS